MTPTTTTVRPPIASSPLLIVISAPSGGGKTTLCQELLSRHPEMTRAITCTTRAPRPGERDGVDYIFLDGAGFQQRIASGDFLEHATVHGHSYGTPKSAVLDYLRRGKDVLLNIDVQGAATFRSRAQENTELRQALVTVFLTPATIEELEMRLRKRGDNSPEDLRNRLNAARQEIAHLRDFQYLIISTTIAEDLRRMETIIDSERMRQSRQTFAF
jgi:guanylate kinase